MKWSAALVVAVLTAGVAGCAAWAAKLVVENEPARPARTRTLPRNDDGFRVPAGRQDATHQRSVASFPGRASGAGSASRNVNAQAERRTPARARMLAAKEYRATGCPHIVGWDWVRTRHAKVTVVFDAAELAGCDVRKVHVNFAGLATNGVNGGSGHDARFVCEVSAGDQAQNLSLHANNPFKPRTDGNSGGVGYYAYGSTAAIRSGIVEQAIAQGALTLTFLGKDIQRNAHVAVRKDTFFLGYIK